MPTTKNPSGSDRKLIEKITFRYLFSYKYNN